MIENISVKIAKSTKLQEGGRQAILANSHFFCLTAPQSSLKRKDKTDEQTYVQPAKQTD